MADDAKYTTCQICEKSDDLKRCAKCKQVLYCSREHQVQDWKIHKTKCLRQHTPKKPDIKVPVDSHTDTHTHNHTHSHSDVSSAYVTGSLVEDHSSSAVIDNSDINRDRKHGVLITEKDEAASHSAVIQAIEASDNENPIFDSSPFSRVTFPAPSSYDLHDISKFVSKGILKDGFCVVDDLLSEKQCAAVFREVMDIDNNQLMYDGKLSGGRESGNEKQMVVNQNIRSDKIMWLNGTETNDYPSICKLVTETMDRIVGGVNSFIEEHIGGRTKVSQTKMSIKKRLFNKSTFTTLFAC